MATTTALRDVIDIIAQTLGIEDRADTLDADTGLFGSLPELDSLAVLELVTRIEDRFDITVGDDEFSGEIFETIGTLAEFVDSKLLQAA